MKKLLLMPVFLIAVVFLFSGCFGVDSNFAGARNDILSSAGKGYSRDVELSLGSITLGMAKFIISFSDDETAEELIQHISGVQFGVYNRKVHTNIKTSFEMLKKLDNRLAKHGWKYIVRSCDGEEATAVYVCDNLENGLEKMFVVSVNSEELVIIEIEGELEKVFEAAIRDRGMNVNM